MKIIEKPIAEMAAAIENSQYSWCGVIDKSFTKLSIPTTSIANEMPNAMARTISSVLMARVTPTCWNPDSISHTKLMSGTPGTINRAQAIIGCHGVVV